MRGPPAALPAAFAPLAALLRRVRHVPQDPEAHYDDAQWVGFRLAEALPFALPVKQTLLELADPIERLAQLTRLLRGSTGAE